MIFDEYTPREFAIKLAIEAIDDAIDGNHWAERSYVFGARKGLKPSEIQQVRNQLTKLRESLADKAPALAMHLDES